MLSSIILKIIIILINSSQVWLDAQLSCHVSLSIKQSHPPYFLEKVLQEFPSMWAIFLKIVYSVGNFFLM